VSSKRFRLVGRVSTSSPTAIKPILEKAVTVGLVKEEAGEFVVEAEMVGENAKDLNRSLLTALRRVEKKTRLRAERTSKDGTTQRYFDYVLKKTAKTGQSS